MRTRRRLGLVGPLGWLIGCLLGLIGRLLRLFGFFLGPVYPGLMAIATRWFVHNLNTVSGVLLVCCGISGMIFPVVMGGLIAWVGVPWGMVIPPLGCLLIAIPLFMAAHKQRLTLQLRRQESTIGETSPLSSFRQ